MPDGDLRVLIVDDEPLARELVREVLAPLAPVRIVGECGDGLTAVREIARLEPDLVLLDVRMPEVDGFGVLRRVGPNAMPEVIFVTAHEDYTLRAFDVHALDYVLKPIDPDRLEEAVSRARERMLAGRNGQLVDRLAALLEREGGGSGAATGPRTLTVRKGDAIRFIDLDDVDWLESARNYVRVHAGGDAHLVRATLKGLARRLDASRFVRIHRSAVVNLDRVRELRALPGGDYAVSMSTGQELRASRTYADRLLELVR
ncbi:MAG TPA: LytTR family DNA-binding domain-containing protein [Gemmatimonadota bacterium]|nr:LytTR family DNA-binding domain-containing protein [Gemmatimonadota bacterium]